MVQIRECPVKINLLIGYYDEKEEACLLSISRNDHVHNEAVPKKKGICWAIKNKIIEYASGKLL